MAQSSLFGKALSFNPDTKQVTPKISRDRKEEYKYDGLAPDALAAALNQTKNWLVSDGVITRMAG